MLLAMPDSVKVVTIVGQAPGVVFVLAGYNSRLYRYNVRLVWGKA